MIRTRRKRKTPVKMKRMKKKKPQPLKKRKYLKRKKVMEVIRLHDQFSINILSLLAITELIIKCYSHSLIICLFSVPTTTIYLCRATPLFFKLLPPATLFLDENCIILNYFCYYKPVFLERLSCRKGIPFKLDWLKFYFAISDLPRQLIY